MHGDRHAGNTPAQGGRWTPFPASGADTAALRLVCLPCAGRGASTYLHWRRLLGEEIEVVAVQLPGREGRATEPAYRDMDRLMADLCPAVEPLLDRPYALFGHSLGADIAFELARLMHRRGLPPQRLFVAAQAPPHHPDPRPMLHRLPHAAFMTMLGLYGQIPGEVLDDPDALALAVATLRADLTVVETYAPAPGPPAGCPITVLAGLADHTLPSSLLRAWGELTDGDLALRLLPGDHFFVETRSAEITSLVRSELENVVDRTRR